MKLTPLTTNLSIISLLSHVFICSNFPKSRTYPFTPLPRRLRTLCVAIFPTADLINANNFAYKISLVPHVNMSHLVIIELGKIRTRERFSLAKLSRDYFIPPHIHCSTIHREIESESW